MGTAANLATPVALSNGANVTFNQAGDGTLTQPITGNGSLGKTGAGVLTLGGFSTYQGTTTVNAGTLRLIASIPNPGLTVQYNVVGAAGSALADGTPIPDLSGSGNNGTMVGSGSYVTAPYGAGFSVSSQYIVGPHLNLTTWTMSEWVQWDNSRYSEAYGLHCLVSGRNGSTVQGAYDSYYSDGSTTAACSAFVPRFGALIPIIPPIAAGSTPTRSPFRIPSTTPVGT